LVTFASILLGLVVGVQPISVLVGDGIVAVEIVLDGRTVAVARGEPWSVNVDFGWRLMPHELLALAFDGEGREVGRARQLVNVPRPGAQAFLVSSSENGRRLARLTWEAVEGAADPLAIRIYLDGELLQVPDPTLIELPADDENRLHLLRAEVDFTETTGAVAELTYGGFFADRVSTDLTALPVLLDKGNKLPPPEDLQGWVRGPDGDLRVVATEKGPADILVVRSSSAVAALEHWWRVHAGSRYGGMFTVRQPARAAFVWPYAEATVGRTRQFWVFPFSPSFSLTEIPLVQLARLEPQPDERVERQRLTDAVAVAGLAAAGRRHRRAVILILGKDAPDESELSPDQARDYLRQLHVPLFVWAAAGPDSATIESWGEVFDTSSRSGMVAAVRDLDRILSAQRILWIDGLHLPNSLVLGEGAAGVSLVAEDAVGVGEAGVITLQ